MDKLETLRHYFGHEGFRPGQEALVDALLQGKDCLGIMPTGAGKSMCYQIPALMRPGIALVISPLISLMKDQVAALKSAGVPAAYLNSSLTPRQMDLAIERARMGAYRVIYVAPERLETAAFRAFARQSPLSLLAVDEAHCVSQWGQDFRPSYLQIRDFVAALPRRPVVAALTATATGEVRSDMTRLLGLRDPMELVTGFDRPNLYFEVLKPKKKLPALLTLVAQRRDKSGIVYCATRTGVEKVCEALRSAGVAATRYHAGLDEEERRQNQDEFRFDRAAVMVATNAFGMGIDKSNVGYVIHYNMPKSVEAYYQEAGRAGRDGEKAHCILLYGGGDVSTARFLIEHSHDNEVLEEAEHRAAMARDYARLEAMTGYCKTTGCLRGYLLDYFGQPHPDRCGNCGGCTGKVTLTDMTRQAQMVLSCVKRVEDKLGYPLGAGAIAQTLRGSKGQRLRRLGLDSLSTYGLMVGQSQSEVEARIDYLLEKGYLLHDPAHGGLTLSPRAGNVLFHGERVEIPLKTALPEGPSLPKAPAESGEADGLFNALRKLRTRLAQREKVPPFMVFSNATLTDMAAKRPRTMAELLTVSGVGEKKAGQYGAACLLTIEEYLNEKE